MIRRVRIEHFVLIDCCELHLASGFNVITGETGAGKSALITALRLALGERADCTCIRHGQEKALVEIEFAPQKMPTLFDEIELEGSTLTLRREIYTSGKNKAYVNDHLVPLNALKKIGSSLVELSNQHAFLSLQQPNAPQDLLDQYAKIDLAEFQKAYSLYNQLTDRLGKLKQAAPLRDGEMDRIKKELTEIEASGVLDVDDKELFATLQAMEEDKDLGIRGTSLLQRLEEHHRELTNMQKEIAAVSDHLKQASEHVAHSINALEDLIGRIEYSEEERVNLEAQLVSIDRLHKKYGPNHDALLQAKKALENRLDELSSQDEELHTLEQKLAETKKTCDHLAQTIHSQRTASAPQFTHELEQLLHQLNMPHAQCSFTVKQTARSSTGDDSVQFLLTPNVGEKKIAIQDHASGGELARVFLSIQTLLADKANIPTILFDEIDASIGGLTANAVGDLLVKMGQKRQILAITHFVQVASKAERHFAISKSTKKGRTISTITHIENEQAKQAEHLRMVGAT